MACTECKLSNADEKVNPPEASIVLIAARNSLLKSNSERPDEFQRGPFAD